MPSLIAYLGLDGSNFLSGVRHAKNVAKEAGTEIKSHLGEFAKSTLTGFGATAGLFGIAEIVHSTIEATERIRQLSREFRVSTDTIQIWDKGAKKVNLTAEDIGNALNKLKKSREKAIEDNDNKGFRQFGLTMEDLKNASLSTEQIMDRMREAASGHQITDQEDVAGMELMGRSGAKVLSAMQEIHHVGPMKLIAEKDIEVLHEADEKLKSIRKQMIIGTAMVAGEVPDWIEGFANATVGLFTNKITPFQATHMGDLADKETAHEAPKFDLKGRPIKSPIAKPLPPSPEEPATAPVIAAQSETLKEAAEIEKLRDDLASKIFENHLKTVTVLQKQVELKKQINELEFDAHEHSFWGDEASALKARIEAEKLRGQLKTDHKAERMDFTSSEKIGAFANISALHSDHAAKTAEATHATHVAVKELLSYVKGYTRDPNNDRARRTHALAQGMTHFG